MSKTYKNSELAQAEAILAKQKQVVSPIPPSLRSKTKIQLKSTLVIEAVLPDGSTYPLANREMVRPIKAQTVQDYCLRGDYDAFRRTITDVEDEMLTTSQEVNKDVLSDWASVSANTFFSEGVPDHMPKPKGKKKPVVIKKDCASIFGKKSVYFRKGITDHLTSQEDFKTCNYVSEVCNTICQCSIANGVEIINKLQHRVGDDAIRPQTAEYLLGCQGDLMLHYTEGYVRRVFAAHDIDPETCKPTGYSDFNFLDLTHADFGIYSTPKPVSTGKSSPIICTHNALETHYDAQGLGAVYITADGVQVKQQKPKRKLGKDNSIKEEAAHSAEGEVTHPSDEEAAQSAEEAAAKDLIASADTKPLIDRKRRSFEHCTASIQVVGYDTMYLVAPSYPQLMALILAILLDNNLLSSHKLIFFIDGQKSLLSTIKERFDFVPHKDIYLDWWHFAHHSKDLFYQCVAGIRSEKYGYFRPIKNWLWRGETERALVFLRELRMAYDIEDPEERERALKPLELEIQHTLPVIKALKPLDQLISYLAEKVSAGMLTNYEARNRAGIKLSSNTSECANRAMVSHHQKKKGKSWSKRLSFAQAEIAMLRLNNSTEKWFRFGYIDFKLQRKLKESA